MNDKGMDEEVKALDLLLNGISDYVAICGRLYNVDGTKFVIIEIKQTVTFSKEGENLQPGKYMVSMLEEEMPVITLEGETVLNEGQPLLFEELIVGITLYTENTPGEVVKAINHFFKDETFKRAPLSEIKTYGLMNDKVNAQLIASDAFTQDTDGQMRLVWAVNQSGKSREPIATYISLMYEGTETKLSKKMTGYDNAVYNAVSTQFYYWRKEHPGEALYITPQELWRTMNGKDGHVSPSAKQVEKTVKSLDKMRFTRFTMDIKAELEAGYISLDDERLVKGEFETYLLKADKVVFETEKGRKVEGYRITDEPILYTYNQAKKHILWVDYDLLNTSDKKNIGDDTIIFTNYLLQRIQNYIGGQLASNRILFESIYQATGIETPEIRIKLTNCSSEDNYRASIRKAFKRDRDTIEAILTSWKDKGKLIKDFKPVKKGNAVIGYDLQIIKPTKKIGNKL